MSGTRKERLPLPTLLSYLLVAFTIEFDNEFEHRLPHRTTNHGSTAGNLDYRPWLVSLVMWLNCLRFVDEHGISVRDLEQCARTKTNLRGMEDWGYVFVEPSLKAGGGKAPRSAWLVRLTSAGKKARAIGGALLLGVEARWRQRFGQAEVDSMQRALLALGRQLDPDLPDCLPILGYGLFSKERIIRKKTESLCLADPLETVPLPLLFSKALLAFALDFEKESAVSFPVSANILRVVGAEGVRVKDLPRLSGVSKEGIGMALTVLTKREFAVIEPESNGSRLKVLQLTSIGRHAQETYFKLMSAIETRWKEQYGEDVIGSLVSSLEGLIDNAEALEQALTPRPDGWRASVPKPETLPHYPMVLHRGGYPDGS